MLWVIFGVLLTVALGFVLWPLVSRSSSLTLPAICTVLIVGASAGLYYEVGSPDVPSGAAEQPDVNEMVASLVARLEQQPDDVEGWLLLARSYEVLKQFDKAAEAYETVLRIDPANPTGLFYGGYIAASRGDYDLAIARWDTIVRMGTASNEMPADVLNSMQRQISVWREAQTSPTINQVPVEQSSSVVTARISLSDAAAASVPHDAALFVFARDPSQPSPPIAVARRALSAEPMIVELSDQNAMVPGRTLSAYSSFEVVARISSSGNAIAQAGDWYGQAVFTSGDSTVIDIIIDTETTE